MRGIFYLEAHSDTGNVFIGFNCYSDLYNCKFESIALPAQRNGKLPIFLCHGLKRTFMATIAYIVTFS